MKSVLKIVLCSLSLSSSLAFAAVELPLHTRVAKYLEEKVVGKTLHFRATGRISEGRIEYVFDRYVSYTDLARTKTGLRFNEVIAIKQANYTVVDGQRTGEPSIRDRSLVKTCEIGQRESTGSVVGFCHYPSSTLMDLTGVAEAMTVTLVDDVTLTFNENSVNYQDMFAPNDKFEPGVVSTKSEFSIVKGKLKRLQKETSYKLDPQTLVRLDATRGDQEYNDLQD